MPLYKPDGTRMTKTEERIFIYKYRTSKMKDKMLDLLLHPVENVRRGVKVSSIDVPVPSYKRADGTMVYEMVKELVLVHPSFSAKPKQEALPEFVGIIKIIDKSDDNKVVINIKPVIRNSLNELIVAENEAMGIRLDYYVNTLPARRVYGGFKSLDSLQSELREKFGSAGIGLAARISGEKSKDYKTSKSAFFIKYKAQRERMWEIVKNIQKLYNKDLAREQEATL